MYTLLVVCCFVGICWATSISTYNMEERCDEELSFIFQDLHQTRVTYKYEPRKNPPTCSYTVESWYYQPELMFYFEDLDFNCSEGTLRISGEDDAHLPGLEYDICGTKPEGVYTGLDRHVKINFAPKRNIFHTSESKEYFKIIFTSFHTGSCKSYEYKCDNGRCINDELSCNGFNSCGDDSDCKHSLSAGIIAGIVIGCIFCVGGIIFVIVLVWLCKRKRPVQNPWQATTSAPTARQQPLAMGGAAYTQGPYPHVVQYQHIQTPDQHSQPHVQYQQAGVEQYPQPVTTSIAPNPHPVMPPPTYSEAVDMSKRAEGSDIAPV